MGLVERQTNTADLSHWRGQIPVSYVYTAGRSGERFFREIMKGRLLAAECKSCGIVYLPPRIYCERCFNRIEDHDRIMDPKGVVHTFTVCRRKTDGSPLEEPRIIAVTKIDGTEAGLVHYLGEVGPEEVTIGMPVEAVFKPKNQRQGTILDIRYFRPTM